MTDSIDNAQTPESSSGDGEQVKGKGKLGPVGYGGAPVLAAGVMVGGAIVFAGWGLTQAMSHEGGIVEALHGDTATHADADPGKDTVTLPDENHNGIPDPYEKGDSAGNPDSGDSGDGDHQTDGRGDEDRANDSDDEGKSDEKDTPDIYKIQPGDTLTEISGDTGVPIGQLVETNKIQDPNLIYAGASLIIPPVD